MFGEHSVSEWPFAILMLLLLLYYRASSDGGAKVLVCVLFGREYVAN